MSELKQVKVDNWGIYFLQRLKHFFNRTDYCDLTLQFQDNAQLKVHRLVLSACTEYFELLERTCEMYEECLVMPDDLQADVVVPIINFMYTGQLEFKIDLLEKLYQTSLIMNMPVLTKLLASHRNVTQPTRTTTSNYYGKRYVKQPKSTPPSSSSSTKRAYSSVFSNTETPKVKKLQTLSKTESSSKNSNGSQEANQSGSQPQFPVFSEKNNYLNKGARPTRYELPEELEDDNIFDNSFTSISYTSKPLMVHPESTKQYRPKRIHLFEEGTSTSRYMHDIVECKKISVNDNMFIDESCDMINDENDIFHQSPQNKEPKDTNQLFDQIIENDVSNITIETKNKQSGSLDHAKIISEVLKKYPHLVKSNKQIKLKILNTSTTKDAKNKKQNRNHNNSNDEEKPKNKNEHRDFTYETDVLDSKEAARLIALGAENVKGPWICLICGTPGKALHFTSYFNFRKHLVEVHNEKPVPHICEYCGLKSLKRNYLVHHQLTKHGVEPPSHYNFPKCNYCDYIALNEALLVKHKITHTDIRNFKRNICNVAFAASVMEAQKSNSKQAYFDKKNNFICMYCLRVFLRQNNLYAHLKTNHKEAAKNDGLIYDSEDEQQEEEEKVTFKSKVNESANYIKMEVPVSYDCEDVQYQLERRPDGNIHVMTKKARVAMPVAKHKILNPGFITQHQPLPSISKLQQKPKTSNTPTKRNEFLQEMCLSSNDNSNHEEIVIIDNNEYIVRDFQLYPKNANVDVKEEVTGTIMPTTSMEFHNIHSQNPDTKMFIKKSATLNQPLQIVVSSEEEYKNLISSNQPVIFDERGSGKTLTVLASSNSNTMETSAIDLNNAQAGDMMIIPEDFSINVSETGAGENPNIVVVYSHPVEDLNKQYQLITAQEVGVEFEPSSQILTQSFETVTSCAPGISMHATGEAWPNNIQAAISKLPIASVAHLQSMTVAESVTVPCENHLNEYPEVTLTSVHEVIESKAIDTQDQNIQNQYEQPIISNIEQVDTLPVVDQHNTIAIVDQPATAEVIQQEMTVEPQIVPLPITNVAQTTVMSDIIEHLAVKQPLISEQSAEIKNVQEISITASNVADESGIPEENIQETVTVNNDMPTIEGSENTNMDIVTSDNCEVEQAVVCNSNEYVVTEVVSNVEQVVNEVNEIENIENRTTSQNEESDAETIENIARDIGVDPKTLDHPNTQLTLETDPTPSITHTEDIPKDRTEDIVETKLANEEIQSLTLEWSEEESEAAESIPSNTDMPTEPVSTQDENPAEIEESIENIQQEVEKHICGEVAVTTHNINVLPVSSKTDIRGKSYNVKKSAVESSIVPNEKITSLLNDWDENDSQKEDGPAVGDRSEEPSTIDQHITLQQILTEKTDDTLDITKNDKIKSLVSDWDEEEDENKD